MRGRVTLAVRGFVGCVGLGAGVEVLILFLVVVMGKGTAAGDEFLMPMVVLYVLSGVQLVLSAVAWFRRGWGWAVWWAVASRLAAELVVVVGEGTWAWSVSDVAVHVNIGTVVVGQLVLLWAGRRVLRGRDRSGWAVEDGAWARESQVGGGNGGEVLAYSRVVRKRRWVGTALVFVGVVMVCQTVSPLIWGLGTFGFVGWQLVTWVGLAVGAGVVVAAVLGLAWRVWRKERRGEDVEPGLKWIAVCATAVVVARMMAPTVASAISSGGLGLSATALKENALWLGISVLGQMGPVVFFVMMVWGEEPGGGEKREGSAGE